MPAETRGSVRQRKKAAADSDSAATPMRTAVVEELGTDESEGEQKDPDPVPPRPTPNARRRAEDDDYSPWVDVLRVLTFLLFASAGLSYLISGGDSFTWGLKHPPKYLRSAWWKEKLTPPLHLTIDELAAFDGTDAAKPVYLAINGTIYDVSANRRTYGPGGSYHVFAGTDAARGFVTGCFREDRTADLRGVEEMHLPADDPAVDDLYTAEALAALKARELAEAREKVDDQLSHWVKFFARSPKYPRVGTVKRERNWLDKEPRKTLCAQAVKGKPKRKPPTDE